MHTLTRRFAKPAGSIGLVLLLLIPASGWGQDRSLVDVAKEKEERKAARIFTNEDVQSPRLADLSEPRPVTPPASVMEDDKARVTVPELLEQATLAEARSILESLKRDEQVLLRRYAQIQEKLATETDAQLRELYTNSLARRDETLARKRKQIEDVRKAMELAEATSPPRGEHETKPK